MQLCELQRVEDFEVIFERDVSGPFTKATMALMEADSSDEQTGEGAGAAAGEEAEGDAHVASGARGSSDRHGDTTESSGGAAAAGEGGGDDDDDVVHAATSPAPATGSDSDSEAYRDEDLERGAPPPVSSPRGKSSVLDVAGQSGGGMRMLADLSSGSEPDSEGSSSVPASKPAASSRKTKELEAASRKAKAVVSPLVVKERRSKSAADEIGRAHV